MFLAPYIGCVVSNLSPTDSGVENTTRSTKLETDLGRQQLHCAGEGGVLPLDPEHDGQQQESCRSA